MTKQLATQVKAPKLTLKQQRFVNEYLKTGNGAEAVRRAGYQLKSKGGSLTHRDETITAGAIATENLNKPLIANAISKEVLKLKLAPENVLNRIDQIADKASKDSDRLKALELLGKHILLFGDTTGDTYQQINIVLGSKPTGTDIVSTQ